MRTTIGQLRVLIESVIKQRFYHASPKQFRYGDILRGGHEGGFGYAHDNVCMTTEPKPHGTIASHIPGWSGWRGNWDEEYKDDPDWFVYEVEPLQEPSYIAGNREYQVRSAKVIKNLGLAKKILKTRKSVGQALPLERERSRRDTQQKRRERNNIDERIRSKLSKFSWNEFVAAQEGLKIQGAAIAANNYASRALQLLGKGSSRNTYVLTSKTVLKIAKFEGTVSGADGVSQNKNEREVYEAHKDLPLTRVLKADDNDVWLVSELVNPINNDEEFKKLTGFSELELDDMCEYDFGKRTVFKPKKKLAKSPFLQLLKRIDASGIDVGDLISHEQWGKNADGEMKLLDSGL